jgi:predicted ATPase with chaperone activity
MYACVGCPTAHELVEIGATRDPGPPEFVMDSPERSDRIRAALTNSGFAVPTGSISSVTPILADWREELPGEPAGFDLPLALSVLLVDRANLHLRRNWSWIAWGALHLDGSLAPVDEPLVNDMGPVPFVGRVWDPTDRLPDPDENAVVSIVEVANLQQAWDVITFFADAEEVILAPANAASQN